MTCHVTAGVLDWPTIAKGGGGCLTPSVMGDRGGLGDACVGGRGGVRGTWLLRVGPVN